MNGGYGVGIAEPARERASQLHHVDGFDQHVIHPCITAASSFLGQCIGGPGDDGSAAALLRSFGFADCPGQRVTIHFRHVAVGDQQCVVAFMPARQCRAAIRHGVDAQAEQLELACQ